MKATAFSDDGKMLAAASADHTVWLWDISNPGHPLVLGGVPITGPTKGVDSVAFSTYGLLKEVPKPDLRDWVYQIIGQGEAVKTQMAAAEDVARRSLAPGSIREIRRRYALEWEGWGLSAPERLSQ